MRRLVAEYEASGKTRVDFARQQGISVAKLDYHRRRLAAREEAPRLLPVEWVAEPLGRGLAVRVELRNGRRLEFDWHIDAAALSRLVAVLESA